VRVPIDATVPQSAGWWLYRLATKLIQRRERLERLADYYRGDPPLPTGAENSRDAYQSFVRKARTNFAELIVEALRERCVIGGFRTSAADDENGDETAWKLWKKAGLTVEIADVIETMFALGDAYMIVGRDDDDGLLVTGEDPRQVVTEHDPRQQRRVIAALKLFHDDIAETDVAYVYLPGRVFRATRQTGRAIANARTFTGHGWEWDTDAGGDAGVALPLSQIPVVRFRNKRGVGEFETHTDLLDRINHMLLQRMVIATMQAFRQRAIIGDLPEYDEQGRKIDYNEELAADPGALWRLPEAVQLWESGQVDLTPILSSVKDDVLHLAAVTRTPLHMFTPDAAAQGSAEGATLQREGLVFRAEDRQERIGEAASQVLSLMFQLANDRERADLADIDVLWRPAERYSLTERTMAATQALAAGVPWATRMTTIMQYSPQDLVRMEIERADDAVLAPATAAVQTIGQQNAAAGAQPAQNAAGAATPAANAPTAQNAAQSGTRPA
jgi:hypothetical protein